MDHDAAEHGKSTASYAIEHYYRHGQQMPALLPFPPATITTSILEPLSNRAPISAISTIPSHSLSLAFSLALVTAF